MSSISKKKQRQNLKLIENAQAEQEGPQKRKTFHSKDLRAVKPLTDTQKDVFDCWMNEPDQHLVMIGSAGTGKSFLAFYFALDSVLEPDNEFRRLVVIRSAVPSRDMGFLPGSLDEKLEVYEKPYQAICDDLFEYKKSYDNMKDKGYIEFESSSYMRGMTIDDAIIVVDEIQNFTAQELFTVLTRVGENSRLILCGDSLQDDLHFKRNDVSGFNKTLRILDKMPSVAIFEFVTDDIVRGNFVREFLIASEQEEG